ncbi:MULTISPECIES: WYL domain-containing protein [unclassified Diaminobutyricimonas]|uniref:helix-turn-helix transcriptional regulator n=1 Tax=unclassified Diaminobutyricimonas TaxID=2643261 RepID=UPI0012F4D474|nr:MULTISPECIES: WYL domain-containing protein [unclassified Diaminobutyricimonas]
MSAIQRVPVEERLFSLVLALLASDNGLTKTEILSTVQGYRQRYSPAGDNSNLERQFERDKDDIRELGVPLETLDSPIDPGNNQNARYRIPRGNYELPDDITFTAEETALLNLAAMVWREGSLSDQSRRALIKLRGLGVETAEPVLGYAPRVRVRDAAFEPLNAALSKRVVVSFDYLKPGEAEAGKRTVLPLALVQHQGRWHLYAEDTANGATRTYLLRRIVSKVTTGKPFDERPGDHSATALAGLDEVWRSNVAELQVEDGTDAATRLQKRRGTERTDSGTLLMHFTDLNVFADELTSYGPEVLVLSPPELREAVRSRLVLVAVKHG